MQTTDSKTKVMQKALNPQPWNYSRALTINSMTSKNCLALKESRQPLSQDNLMTYIKGISLISLRIPLNMVSQEEIVKKKKI